MATTTKSSPPQARFPPATRAQPGNAYIERGRSDLILSSCFPRGPSAAFTLTHSPAKRHFNLFPKANIAQREIVGQAFTNVMQLCIRSLVLERFTLGILSCYRVAIKNQALGVKGIIVVGKETGIAVVVTLHHVRRDPRQILPCFVRHGCSFANGDEALKGYRTAA